MNLVHILGKVGKAVLNVADAGATAHVPVLSEIDRIADSVRTIKGQRKIDEEQIHTIIAGLQQLKQDVPMSKSALRSNRFKMTLIGLVTAIAVNFGLSQELAAELSEVIVYIVGAYVIGDTIRPSIKFGK